MRTLAAAVPLFLILSGCAGTPEAQPHLPGTGAGGTGDGFVVPWLHVGDELSYEFTFTQASGRSFSGATTLRVIGLTTTPDGYGTQRPAIHLRQSNPDGSFAEDYFVDAKSFRQIKLERRDTYNETATLQAPPPAPLPTKRSYANATGVLERYAFDPYFEDANMFGIFATGQPIPETGSFPILGALWQRNGTRQLLATSTNGTISVPGPDARWGPLRTLDFAVSFKQGETYFEDIAWNGDFAATVPFAVRAERILKANFFGDQFDVKFLLTLTDYKAGTGELLVRQDGAPSPKGPAGARADAPQFPADGSGDNLAFPLSQAMASLRQHPTALDFFNTHAGSYLYFAEMNDVDTCRFYQQGPPPPGCHWLQWFGVFFAPDDWMLTFFVEKYANADGTGAAYAPVVSRDAIFTLLFESAGGDPQIEPSPSIVAENSGVDLPERSAYPADSLTIAGALDLWKAGASDKNDALQANFLWTHLTSSGYEFEVEHRHWEFPAENPELFPMYDNMPFELTRHRAAIQPDGFVVEHRNYDIVIEHR